MTPNFSSPSLTAFVEACRVLRGSASEIPGQVETKNHLYAVTSVKALRAVEIASRAEGDFECADHCRQYADGIEAHGFAMLQCVLPRYE